MYLPTQKTWCIIYEYYNKNMSENKNIHFNNHQETHNNIIPFERDAAKREMNKIEAASIIYNMRKELGLEVETDPIFETPKPASVLDSKLAEQIKTTGKNNISSFGNQIDRINNSLDNFFVEFDEVDMIINILRFKIYR